MRNEGWYKKLKYFPPMTLNKPKQVKYFLKHLKTLPEPYSSQDVNRMVLAFFCVNGLALLDSVHLIDKEKVITWIYSLQIPPDSRDPVLNERDCGFRGGPWLGNDMKTPDTEYHSTTYDTSSIATTFAALSVLRVLGDDFSRVYRANIISALKSLQNPETGR